MLRLGLVIIALTIAALMGCDRQEPAPPTESGPVAGAAASHYLTGASRPAATTVSVPPAPRPTGPLPEGASCVTAECHAKFQTAARRHGPVAAGACDACHEEDAGGHRYPMKGDARQTCTHCHAVSGTMVHQHKALDGGCQTCHDPHVSTAKFLLKADSTERLCSACHDVPFERFAHTPFAQGDCTVCHQPHQADNKAPLRGGDGSKHCFTCHENMRGAMVTASKVHEPASKDCTSCHNPHSSAFAHQLRAAPGETCLGCHQPVKEHVAAAKVQHAAMLTAGQCSNCHDAHASNQPALLRQRMDQVCLTCHDKAIEREEGRAIANMKPQLQRSQFLHGPVKAGDCSSCHDAHGAAEANLLTEKFPASFYSRFELGLPALCFKCHEKDLVLAEKTESLTEFRDGDRNLHFLHVNRDEKGRSCKTCHAIHGSNRPNHIADSVPFEGSKWAMPIEFARQENGGSCTPGCHDHKRYERRPAKGPATRGSP